MDLSPFVKQMFVATSSQLASISMGGTLGYPLVLIQQFQSNETTIQTDIDTISWIASMHGVAGIGATVMPTIMQIKGRKCTFIGSCFLLLIGWILAFAAMDVTTLIWSAAFHGLASNCITIVNLVTISEMLAPKYRPACMILLLINQSVGQVLVSTLGTFLGWRTDALIMCVPIVLAIVMAFVWPESPSWLAYKGKFEDSKTAFKWLRGTNDEATAELQALIAAQKELRKKYMKKTILQDILQKIKMKDFYIPILYMFLILFNFYLSGGMSLFIYCQDTIKMGTNPEIAVLGYLLTVSTLLFGTILSILLIKYLKSKTIMCTSFGCGLCLFSLSLISYLRTVGAISKDSLIFLYFFLAYMIFSGSGLVPISFTLAIELVPVKHRGIGGALFNIITCLLNVVTVKSFPYMVLYINLSVILFIFAVINLIRTILILIYVPETKNRTLQEIEDYYNFGTFVRRRVSEDSELKVPMILETSMHGVAGIGATVMPTIMQIKGRKYTFIGSCLLLLIGWILAFAAMDAATLIWSAAFHGLASNCITVVNLVTISEMLAPKYRPACMILLLINQTIGQVLVSYLGIFLDWRTDALIMCVLIVLAIVMAFVWPESPSWLAYKGKFEDSKAAFKWLRGTNDEATAELQALIAAQKESRKKATKKTKLQDILQKIKMKDFYVPILYMFLLLFNFYSAGGISLFIYCQDTIKIGTNPEIAVLGSLLTVSTLLFGSMLSLLLIRYLKSKTIMYTFFGCSICLFSCSFISYLRTVSLISKESLIFLYFFLGYMIFCDSGLSPISFTLAIELVPVKHRGIGGALFNIITCFLNVVTVKSFPYMVLYINLSGTLLIFAVSNLICTILIFIYVPETKNRTLQEIEDYYNFGTFGRRRVSENSELNVPMIMKSNIVN